MDVHNNFDIFWGIRIKDILMISIYYITFFVFIVIYIYFLNYKKARKILM